MEEPLEDINDGRELYFPPEVLYEVLKNLNVQDLGRAALVNKLWNETVSRVLKKRGPEITLISLPNYNVYDYIRIKPLVAFIFVAPEIRHSSDVLKRKVIEKYEDQIPYNFVTVGARRLLIDEELITANDYLLDGKILGLLVPDYRDLNVRVVYTQDLNRRLIAKNFLDHLLPEDSNMEKRQQKYSLWGTSVDEVIFARASSYVDTNTIKIEEGTSCKDILQLGQCDDIEHKMFAMSITGSSVESWAIVISCPTKKHEFHKKLLDFRSQLRLRRCSIGLVSGPQKVRDNSHGHLHNVYTDYREMMHAVKTVFPDVSFIGIYNDVSIVHGLKSKAEDPNQTLEHHKSLSLMILT